MHLCALAVPLQASDTHLFVWVLAQDDVSGTDIEIGLNVKTLVLMYKQRSLVGKCSGERNNATEEDFCLLFSTCLLGQSASLRVIHPSCNPATHLHV